MHKYTPAKKEEKKKKLMETFSFIWEGLINKAFPNKTSNTLNQLPYNLRRRLQSNSFFFLTLKQLDTRGTKYLEISIVVKKKRTNAASVSFF